MADPCEHFPHPPISITNFPRLQAHPAGPPPQETRTSPVKAPGGPPARGVSPTKTHGGPPTRGASPIKTHGGPPALAQAREEARSQRSQVLARAVQEEDDEEEEEEEKEGDKNKGKRKKNKKKKKKNRPELWAKAAVEAERRKKAEDEAERAAQEDVEVEYIQEQLDLDPLDPMYRTFSKIFQAFKIVDPAEEKAMEEEEVGDGSFPLVNWFSYY